MDLRYAGVCAHYILHDHDDDGWVIIKQESESRQLSRRYSWHNEEPASSSLLCASLFTAMSPRPSNPKIDIGNEGKTQHA